MVLLFPAKINVPFIIFLIVYYSANLSAKYIKTAFREPQMLQAAKNLQGRMPPRIACFANAKNAVWLKQID
jgi:hypothetical protein